MNVLAFWEFTIYVLHQLSTIVMGLLFIFFGFWFGGKGRLRSVVATLFTVVVSIFFIFTPVIQLIYFCITGEPA